MAEDRDSEGKSSEQLGISRKLGKLDGKQYGNAGFSAAPDSPGYQGQRGSPLLLPPATSADSGLSSDQRVPGTSWLRAKQTSVCHCIPNI